MPEVLFIMKKIMSIICVLSLVLALAVPVSAEKTEKTDTMGLSAKAAVLMNAETGEILYGYNSDERLPEASITKVMTLLLVFEAIDSGKISYDDEVRCSAHAASMGGSQIWLEEGESMTVDELLKATVVGSANDAAVALAEHIAGSHESFVVMMNDRARELNMTQTSYKNCTGLDAEGHLTSALDVAIVSAELLKHEDILNYSTIWMDTLRNGELELANTNKLLRSYPDAIGLKTGTTSQAGCCVSAVARRDGMTLIAVIMGAPNSKSRFADAAALLDYGFANWEIASVADYMPETEKIKVKAGVERSLSTTAVLEGYVLVEKGRKGEIAVEISYDGEVTAPVASGQTVGTVQLTLDNEVLGEYKIITTAGTERVTFAKAFACMLKSLVSLS